MQPQELEQYKSQSYKVTIVNGISNVVLVAAGFNMYRMFKATSDAAKKKIRSNLITLLGVQFIAIGIELAMSQPLFLQEKEMKRKYLSHLSDQQIEQILNSGDGNLARSLVFGIAE